MLRVLTRRQRGTPWLPAAAAVSIASTTGPVVAQGRRTFKGTAMTLEEREKRRLRGLLPPRVETMDEQLERVLWQVRQFTKSVNKYNFLQALRERNEPLFFKLLTERVAEFMPIVYTPTIGEACKGWGYQWRTAQGMFLGAEDKGSMRRILDNWPESDIDIIVVTDGSRILGLGDLGANGMGIPIGKLALYSAIGGFHPSRCLPVMLDLGTDNEELLSDRFYLGLKQKRLRGREHAEIVDEFMLAVKDKWPGVVVQFEDFSNNVAFDMLHRWRDRALCFNDDIQGTGAVALAGMINAVHHSGIPFDQHRFVFSGAGSAAVGIADRLVSYLEHIGVSRQQALKQFWLVDSKGLVASNRGDDLAPHKIEYARGDVARPYATLQETVDAVKPTALLGLSSQGGSFTADIIRSMHTPQVPHPIIFPLSNPTAKAECSAENAFRWTNGAALFASGSPFDTVVLDDAEHIPSQCNNVYIFNGLGRGASLAQARCITDTMINEAAAALAESVSEAEAAQKRLFPKLERIRSVTIDIAARVYRQAVADGVAGTDHHPEDIRAWIASLMYHPVYGDEDLNPPLRHALPQQRQDRIRHV